ncbi:MAG TPA: hypothetical protein ENJ42_06850, partial [Hellea balneolensis]|nr:hypothetical protein [Hellea balneolensis]
MNILRLLGFFGLGIFLGLGPRLPDIVYDAPEPSLEIEAPQPNKYRISEPARTGDILINQLGYMTDDPKFASIVQPLSTPISWQIKDATGHIVLSGKSRYFGQDPASGLTYHTVDFSALTIPADGYILQAAGKSSAPFSIRRNLYGRLKTDALLYFTHSLAGAPIKAEFAR